GRNQERSLRRAYAASWRLSLGFGNWQDAITRKSHCPAPDSPDGDRTRGLSGGAHTHTKKKGRKKERELGASCSGLRPRLHPNGLALRATATPRVTPAPTLQVTRPAANFGLRRPLGAGRVQRPRAARSLSQTRPCGLRQQRHAACAAQPRRWPSPAVFSPCGRRLQVVAS
uniref:Uncharacterized protein n=1 Tax=Peromyscus maniculatus bairdii TaxID=230844 RepID=A0A8C8UFZ3_PERMB